MWDENWSELEEEVYLSDKDIVDPDKDLIYEEIRLYTNSIQLYQKKIKTIMANLIQTNNNIGFWSTMVTPWRHK